MTRVHTKSKGSPRNSGKEAWIFRDAYSASAWELRIAWVTWRRRRWARVSGDTFPSLLVRDCLASEIDFSRSAPAASGLCRGFAVGAWEYLPSQ
jgi:hypothetical protein